jgi:TIR domain
MTAGTPATPGRIFINYRRKDTDGYAGWLFERLADHFGQEQIFKDIDSIKLGDDFAEKIHNAVVSCQVLLALIGDKWLTATDEEGRRRLDNPKDFVRLEIEAALSRNILVIPILLDGAEMPSADQLPSNLAGLVRRQALKLSVEDFNHNIGKLLEVLNRTFSKLQAAPAAPDAEIAITRPPESDTETEQRIAEVPAGDWAICCSGGAIRSAAYCLGALQSLDQGGLLAKVKWILGVSGGSHIASSHALVAHELPAGTLPHAYAPGTPEERNLRNNTRNLAPSVATMLVGFLSLFLGAMAAFIVILAPLFALAHACGWLLRWQGVLVPSGPRAVTAAMAGLAWWLPTVIVAGITLALLGYWTLGPGDRRPGRAALVGWVAVLASGLVLAMLAAPRLISSLITSTGSPGTIARFLGFGARPSWLALAGLIAIMAAVARYCQAGLAKWNASSAAVKGRSVASPGLLNQLAGRLRQQLLPWVASAVIVLAGFVLALLWTYDGARTGFSGSQLLPVVAALCVVLFARVVMDANHLSLHNFSRQRLAQTFAITRGAEAFNRVRRTLLSDLRDDHVHEPGLVICCTANITATREVPRWQDGFGITFDPEHVTLLREKSQRVIERSQALTSDYEALVGKRTATLFDVSAISGPAISPTMRAATRRAYRILLTAGNVRLGVWLPHPNLVRDARRLIDQPDKHYTGRRWERRPLLLLLWYLLPHLFWDRQPERNSVREARLWAHVLRLRVRGERSAALWYRALQPTLGLLWAEATGRLSYRSIWMYVTDGSHYDNLGLVEALRRGASHIVVLDASGDKADTWSTLGRAMTLASSGAGVDVELDPTAMVSGERSLAPGQVVRPWTYGRFRRQEEAPGLPSHGEIWVCKLGWWAGAPWNVRAYAQDHPAFPGDSALEQLNDVAEFDAYQQLGVATVLDAAKHCTPPLVWTPTAITVSVSGRGRSGTADDRPG